MCDLCNICTELCNITANTSSDLCIQLCIDEKDTYFSVNKPQHHAHCQFCFMNLKMIIEN